MILKILQRILNLFGYQAVLESKPSAGNLFGLIQPQAKYSPWNVDEEFLKTYRMIKAYTLVDIYRCYELWTLVEQSRKLQGGIIEIGVYKGGTGALIAHKAKLCSIPDPVYLCDTFAGLVKAGPEDKGHYSGGEYSVTRQYVEELAGRFHLDNVRILSGVFPEDTAKDVSVQQFRLCHIDVDVYGSARDVLDWVWPKMVVGGMVVYDDYGFCAGVLKHVEDQRDKSDRLVIHNLNGHAVIVKIK